MIIKLVSHTTKKYFLFALLLLSVLSPCALSQADTESGSAAIENGSFEDGAKGWNIPNGAAKVVSDVHHSGSHSLYYKNDDPKNYVLFTQSIHAKPGQKVHFSVWMKGQNVLEVGKEGSKAGAAIFMESSNGATYLGGKYSAGKNGSFDWTHLTGDYTVPLNSTRTTVGVYFRPGVTGEAWFDDVEVVAESEEPFKSTLLFPNYRGIVPVDNITPWRINIQVNRNPNWKGNSITAAYTLIDTNKKVLFRKSQTLNSDQPNAEIRFPSPKSLSLGNYILQQEITDPNGTSVTRNFPIHVVKEMPQTYIDDHGFTVVNGKRFFPMGAYFGPVSERYFDIISKGGFNTVLAYGHGKETPEEYLDRAEKYNVKVIYSLKDLYPGVRNQGEEAFDKAADNIKRAYNKPALLAWYTNDEMGASWAGKIQKMYDQIQRLDTEQHPVFQVVMIGDLEQASHSGDVLGTDPYPVRKNAQELLQTSLNTRVSAQVANGAKGLWMVPQIFDHAVYTRGAEPNPPTLDEMRNQAYQAIINGASGLIWYSYFDLWFTDADHRYQYNDAAFRKRWPDVTAMTKEINKITPTILQDEKVLLSLPQKPEVEVGAWKQGNELALLFANPYYEEKSITFVLPQGWIIKDAEQGEIKSTFANDKVTFTLPSIGSGVFRLIKN